MNPSMNRRRFLTLGGAGALGAMGFGLSASAASPPGNPRGRIPVGEQWATLVSDHGKPIKKVGLIATDGYASMPKGSKPHDPFYPDPIAPDGTDTYIFGFRNVTGLNRGQVEGQRGLTQISAPIEFCTAGEEMWITLSNLGLSIRPDLVDSHTLHWHGFRNAIPFYDGVPESSISVPIGRDFTYVFQPATDDWGTYMYHCHFEDVEHVTMGMSGIVFVAPSDAQLAPSVKLNGYKSAAYGQHQSSGGTGGSSYGDSAGASAFHRQYVILLTEIDSRAHFNDGHIQATDWTDWTANFWCMNGRAYPDTLAPNGSQDATGVPLAPVGYPASISSANDTGTYDHLAHQPNSSLIVGQSGEHVLVRLANLGFQEQSLSLPGLPMRIVGSDARFRDQDNSVRVDTIDIGPGESRDVIIELPTVTTKTEFPFFNRDVAKYPGIDGDQWSGGQRTHVVVVPTGTLKPQGDPNTVEHV